MKKCSKPGCLNLSTTDTLDWVILCGGGHPVHCGVFGSIPRPCPIDASGTHIPNCDNQKCLLGEEKFPPLENHCSKSIWSYRGAWMAQSVKHLILDFSSGCDFMVCEFKPHIRLCAGSMEPPRDSPSPSFSAPSPLSPSENKKKSVNI